jgi:hypothetical protein
MVFSWCRICGEGAEISGPVVATSTCPVTEAVNASAYRAAHEAAQFICTNRVELPRTIRSMALTALLG